MLEGGEARQAFIVQKHVCIMRVSKKKNMLQDGLSCILYYQPICERAIQAGTSPHVKVKDKKKPHQEWGEREGNITPKGGTNNLGCGRVVVLPLILPLSWCYYTYTCAFGNCIYKPIERTYFLKFLYEFFLNEIDKILADHILPYTLVYVGITYNKCRCTLF